MSSTVSRVVPKVKAPGVFLRRMVRQMSSASPPCTTIAIECGGSVVTGSVVLVSFS
jgi:hypothetical protein